MSRDTDCCDVGAASAQVDDVFCFIDPLESGYDRHLARADDLLYSLRIDLFHVGVLVCKVRMRHDLSLAAHHGLCFHSHVAESDGQKRRRLLFACRQKNFQLTFRDVLTGFFGHCDEISCRLSHVADNDHHVFILSPQRCDVCCDLPELFHGVKTSAVVFLYDINCHRLLFYFQIILIRIALSSDHDPCFAMSCKYHRRSSQTVVVACHGISVSPRGIHGEQIA